MLHGSSFVMSLKLAASNDAVAETAIFLLTFVKHSAGIE